jgi:alpha-D-ribose 1-methylphosphonate 5-triphosphate synthase subunit PhnI
MMIPELGFTITIGRVKLTECQMVNQFKGSAKAAAAIHPRLWSGVRSGRAQGDGDVAV